MLPTLLTPILAWQEFEGFDPDAAAGAAAAAGIAGLIIYLLWLLGTLIGVVVMIWIHYTALSRVPPPHRQMEPWNAFLLLVPCLNIVWLFLLPIKTGDSLKRYFASIGRTDVGDGGTQLGIIAGVTMLVCGLLGWIVAIMYAMKVNKLLNEVRA